ncbi:hypothetical protein MKZ38_009492 [Zalerion maritima]|uniref:VOC domain-containing protein n=1 Tax=Zalerion maritima TaxID=339359 RepID=A0AAD5RG67_9PEZI|nr:hypothetical protein MKZ38_009492 [Zalerion maritima]
MPLGHVSLSTGKLQFDRMRQFYIDILAPLGYGIFKEESGCYVGFAPKYGSPDFWLHADGSMEKPFDPAVDMVDERQGKTHVAFAAHSPKVVQRWHEAALKAGGVDNGKPGERPQYVKGYYGAFVIDPLGNNVEVMHWSPWWLKLMVAGPSAMCLLGGWFLGAAVFPYFSPKS